MEKRDYKIGERFTTTEGKTYETHQSPATDCNLCKGCNFRELVKAEEDDSSDFYTCAAPNGTRCSYPSRIFVLINKTE